MKQFFSLFIAGALGGLVTLGGLQYLHSVEAKPTEKSHFAKAINNNVNVKASALAALPDFRVAAKKAMPVVVNITTSKGGKKEIVDQDKNPNKRQKPKNPLEELFGGDIDMQGFEELFKNQGRAPRQGTGSGVIYKENGFIVTNNHVVDGADNIEVRLYDGRTFDAEVIGTDKTTDLAVIKIDESGLPYLNIGDSDRVEVGEWALAVGNPLDLTSTVTAGIISAKGRSIGIIKEQYGIENFIQTDAAVNPGNSGGALINQSGDLIGINTAIVSRTGMYAGYSFAIPSNLVRKVANDLIQYGESQRAVIGIHIADLDKEFADELKVNLTSGIVVTKLVDGGAGQYAGMLPNDIITAIDGRKVKTHNELQETIGRKKPGDSVVITINRKGQIKKIPVILKAG